MKEYVPLGWHTHVPAIREGQPLRYFTPEPLSRIIANVRRKSGGAPEDLLANRALASAIFGAMVQQRYGLGEEKQRIAALELFRLYVLNADAPVIEKSDLLRIAARISGEKANQFRADIVYSGPAAAKDSHLFAIEDSIEALVSDLVDVLKADHADVDVFDLSAITLFYCLSTHPFSDGNGRFSRFIVIALSAKLDDPSSGALMAGLQLWNRRWYGETALKARESGFHDFIEEMRAAHEKSRGALEHKVVPYLNMVSKIISRQRNGQKELRKIVLDGMVKGGIKVREVKEGLCCSQRKASDLLLQFEQQDLAEIREEMLSYAMLKKEIVSSLLIQY